MDHYYFPWKIYISLVISCTFSGLIGFWWIFKRHEYSTMAIIVGFMCAWVGVVFFLTLIKFLVDQHNSKATNCDAQNRNLI
jgi:hypothetical protein